MNQEEKQLLLKDICGRLPYGVRVWYKYETWISKKFATSIRLADEKIALSSKFNKEGDWFSVEEAGEILIKPYLRPLSSMTEEERKEYNDLYYQVPIQRSNGNAYRDTKMVEALHIDWLNKKMFDYRRLIPKGLALEAQLSFINDKAQSILDETTQTNARIDGFILALKKLLEHNQSIENFWASYSSLVIKLLKELVDIEHKSDERNDNMFPFIQEIMRNYNPPCYAPNGICTNPQMDCISCPKRGTGGTWTTSTNTNKED